MVIQDPGDEYGGKTILIDFSWRGIDSSGGGTKGYRDGGSAICMRLVLETQNPRIDTRAKGRTEACRNHIDCKGEKTRRQVYGQAQNDREYKRSSVQSE